MTDGARNERRGLTCLPHGNCNDWSAPYLPDMEPDNLN